MDTMLNWYFRGFADEVSPWMKYIEPLPLKPTYYMAQSGVKYNPEWPIRVNIDHFLGDPENMERIPEEVRCARNLPLLLETGVELALATREGQLYWPNNSVTFSNFLRGL